MGLRNQQEALIEFLKLKGADLFVGSLQQEIPETVKQTHTFNPVDMFYL
jgi:hypothetical protein